MSENEQTVVKPVLIYRHVALEVAAFDLLKSWQRYLKAKTGQRLTNSQVLNFILNRHPGPTA